MNLNSSQTTSRLQGVIYRPKTKPIIIEKKSITGNGFGVFHNGILVYPKWLPPEIPTVDSDDNTKQLPLSMRKVKSAEYKETSVLMWNLVQRRNRFQVSPEQI